MEPTSFSISTGNGYELSGNCYEPGVALVAGVVIAPAMAVHQTFYASFAQYLAQQGFRVWTFDYHGVGDSRPNAMRACVADVSSWVCNDFNSVVKYASDELVGLPLFVLGHSIGGLITPLLPSVGHLSGVINIAVGSGAKRHLQPDKQRSTPWLWHLVSPVLCFIFGYFPGARIGLFGDIPRRAMTQWRGWCLNSDYLLGAEPAAKEAYAALSCPMLSLFFADDELLQESGARWLHGAYSQAQLEYRVINAADLGVSRIGHFGFFKSRQGLSLWPIVSDWLGQRSSTLS